MDSCLVSLNASPVPCLGGGSSTSVFTHLVFLHFARLHLQLDSLTVIRWGVQGGKRGLMCH